MMAQMKRVPVREQDPKVRAHNFEEVCYGYDEEEAVLEASRCLNCRNPRCVSQCPVGIRIPEFIANVKAGDFKEAGRVTVRFRQSAAGSAPRRRSAKEAASSVSRASRWLSANWSASWLTGTVRKEV